MKTNIASLNAERFLKTSKTGKVIQLIFDADTNELVNYKFYQKTHVAQNRIYMTVEDMYYTIDSISYDNMTSFATVFDKQTKKTIASRYVMNTEGGRTKMVIGIGAKSVSETYNDIFIYSEKVMRTLMAELNIKNPDHVHVDLSTLTLEPIRILNVNTSQPYTHISIGSNGIIINNKNYQIYNTDKAGNALVTDMHETNDVVVTANNHYHEWVYHNATTELFQFLITQIYNKRNKNPHDIDIVTGKNLFDYGIIQR